MKNEQSCGALIYKFNQNKRQFLMIKHKNGNHYGFPKGHVEANETPIETAFREVFEETGVKSYLYRSYKAYTTYHPKPDVYKEVTYFIGKPLNDTLKRQASEVIDVFWVDEDKVAALLTYQGDKDVFTQLYEAILVFEKDVPKQLFNHIEKDILPVYDTFDEGHHRDHIYEVINASFDLVMQYPAQKDMVYLVACFHDLGLQFGRDTHHITSGDLLKKDPYVISHYSKEDIHIMVEAIFDHRASNAHEPRTIYGKILSEADRLLDVDKVIERTVLYELHKHPNLDMKGQLKNAFDHILEKYGEKGYLTRYLDYEPNRLGEEALDRLIKDKKLLYETLESRFEKLKIWDD